MSVLACFETLSYKNFLRNKSFAKLTGKHLCQSLFFNKGAGLPYFPAFGMNKGRHGVIRIVSLRIQSECGKIRQACNFITKETLVKMFSCEFCEIFKSTFFTELFLDDFFLMLDMVLNIYVKSCILKYICTENSNKD